MTEKIKIGIVVADDDEFKPLADLVKKGDYTEERYLERPVLNFKVKNGDVTALLCGIGKVNAAAAAAHLVDAGCDILLNYGLSGGISGVRRGDICFCDKFLEHDFDLTGIGYKPCEKPSQRYIYSADKRLLSAVKEIIPDIKTGTAVTGDRFVCDEKRRDFLKNEFGAMSCDMETAAIAYVCDYSETPFASLRKISDDAGEDAESCYREMNVSGETTLAEFILKLSEKAVEIPQLKRNA